MRNIILTAIMCLAPIVGSAANSSCPELDGRTVAQMLTYLQGGAAALKPACVVSAMDALSASKDPASLPTLMRLLDYDASSVYGGPYAVLARSIGRARPTHSPIFVLGQVAVPYLLEVVRSPESSPAKRREAVELVMAINREDIAAGVRVIHRETLKPQASDSMNRWLDARERALKFCGPKSRAACQAVTGER